MASKPKPPRGNRNAAQAGTIRRGGPATNIKPVRVPPGAGAGMGPPPMGAPPMGGPGMGAPPPMPGRGRRGG